MKEDSISGKTQINLHQRLMSTVITLYMAIEKKTHAFQKISYQKNMPSPHDETLVMSNHCEVLRD